MSPTTLTTIAMSIFLSMTFIDETGVAVTLPSIQAEFGISALALQWTLNAFFLTLAVFVLPAGHSADRLGARRVFDAGMAVFVVASLGCGFSASGELLIAARAVQGVGAAMMLATYALLIARVFPPERQGAALGTSAAYGAFFLAIGPFLGGFIAEQLSWRWIFHLNAPLGLLVFLIVRRAVPGDTEPMRMPDIKPLSLASFIFGFGGLIVALMQAVEWGWRTPHTLGLFACAVLGLTLFLLLQRSSRFAMVDLSLFRHKAFSSANLILLTTQVCVMCVAFWALWSQVALGMSPQMAGLSLLPAGLPILVVARLGGIWADRAGPHAPIRLGVLLVASSAVLFAVTSAERSYLMAFAAMLLYGIGAPLVISPAIKAVLISAPDGKQGQASGILNTMRQLGAALAFGVIGAVLNFHDRLNTARVVGDYPALVDGGVLDAQDVLVKSPEALANLPAAARTVVETALSQGYADAFGIGMWGAVAFALVGCIAAYLGLAPARHPVVRLTESGN